ncbi:MAG: hypothetical protein GX986_06380 [Firmicutes bacterium]|nr:hypothetical protein [Bacillota bacterium]
MEKERQSRVVMTLEGLNHLPPGPLPCGYTLRSFRPGDEEHWENIIFDAFGRFRSFAKTMAEDSYFAPQRIIFACHFQEGPIATAAAWHAPNTPDNIGYLYMVGALQAHTGNGLGYCVCARAINQMIIDGKTSALLVTDSFRLPAIKTYLKLGFQPKILHLSQLLIWDRIMHNLNHR